MTATTKIERAMVLAAGLGQRMRPLTDSKPKALVEVAGRSLIDRALDRIEAAGVGSCVVNTYHLAAMLRRHLVARKRPQIVFSPEDTLLETGGGVKHALPLLGSDPFYVVNCDALWLDGPSPTLKLLARLWDSERMDALLLVQSTVSAIGYDGVGDYFMEPDGVLRRRIEEYVAPFVFTGVQILAPALFKGAPDGAFSLRDLYDRAQEAGRLFGVRNDGLWFHVGTPDSVTLAEALISGNAPQDQV
ncbi:MAG: nucleotidyltransferase family protein [Rhodospirillales bacterium]